MSLYFGSAGSVATYLPLQLFATASHLTLEAPSLSTLQLRRVEKHFICFFLAVSRAIMDDVLEPHKDKNYLVWLATHNMEEWNDEANEEGQREHQDR